MTLKSPKCAWCKRAMRGAPASQVYCSTGCETADAASRGDVKTGSPSLDARLKLWHERAAGPPTYVDDYFGRRTPEWQPSVNHLVQAHASDASAAKAIANDAASRAARAISRDSRSAAQQAAALKLAKFPQVGEEASIPCPHCDGPMVVVNVIHDETVIECPSCSKEPQS